MIKKTLWLDNPIGSYYETFREIGRRIIQEEIDTFFHSALKVTPPAVANKEQVIKKLKTQNGWIIFTSILLFGLPWIDEYHKNRKKILELEQEIAQDSDSLDYKLARIQKVLQTTRVDKLVQAIFQKLGIVQTNYFDFEQAYLALQTFLSFDSRIKVSSETNGFPKILKINAIQANILNNRPVYDVEALILEGENNQPKVFRWIIGMTNFLSNLTSSFDTERLVVWHSNLAETLNQELSETNKIDPDCLVVKSNQINRANEIQKGLKSGTFQNSKFNYAWSGREVDLNQLFSPSAQENIRNWSHLKTPSGDATEWGFFGGLAFCFNKAQKTPKGSIWNYLNLNKQQDEWSPYDVQTELQERLEQYFEEWFNRTQWMLLFPEVAQEWYNHNLYYSLDSDSSDNQQFERPIVFPDQLILLERSITDFSDGNLLSWIDLDKIKKFVFNDRFIRNNVLFCQLANNGKVETQEKIVYLVFRMMENNRLNFIFSKEFPKGELKAGELMPGQEKFYNQVASFFRKQKRLLNYLTFRWQDNSGIVTVQHPDWPEKLEEKFETWMSELTK